MTIGLNSAHASRCQVSSDCYNVDDSLEKWGSRDDYYSDINRQEFERMMDELEYFSDDYDDYDGGGGERADKEPEPDDPVEQCTSLALSSTPGASSLVDTDFRINNGVAESFHFNRWIPQFSDTTTFLSDYITNAAAVAGAQAGVSLFLQEAAQRANAIAFIFGHAIGLSQALNDAYRDYKDRYYSKFEQETMLRFHKVFNQCLDLKISPRRDAPPVPPAAPVFNPDIGYNNTHYIRQERLEP